jgi:hypothetical protein
MVEQSAQQQQQLQQQQQQQQEEKERVIHELQDDKLPIKRALPFHPSEQHKSQLLDQLAEMLQHHSCTCRHHHDNMDVDCYQSFQHHPGDVYRLRSMFVYGMNSQQIDDNLYRYFRINVNPIHDHGRGYTLNGVPCCTEAFCTLLGISRERFDRVYKQWTQDEAAHYFAQDKMMSTTTTTTTTMS